MFEEILSTYERFKGEIEERLRSFRELQLEDDRRVFAELCFCLLTPQSKAKVCWAAIEDLMSDGLLFVGGAEDIESRLKGVRFKKNKARYIVSAREFFTKGGKLAIKEFINGFSEPFPLREFLVRNVKGLGYKEASHFLRNVGMGDNIAILDRHILRNLKAFGVIEDIPKTITRKRYLAIEEKMREFSKVIGVPLSHLDLVLWAKETGEVFK